MMKQGTLAICVAAALGVSTVSAFELQVNGRTLEGVNVTGISVSESGDSINILTDADIQVTGNQLDDELEQDPPTGRRRHLGRNGGEELHHGSLKMLMNCMCDDYDGTGQITSGNRLSLLNKRLAAQVASMLPYFG